MCGHGWVVCDEMRMVQRIYEVASSQGVEASRATLMKEYDSKSGSDGYCRNKSVVRRMIAALWACNNQFLGKVLTEMALNYDGIGEFWASRLVYVLDQLIIAFNFQKSEQQAPKQPLNWKMSARWGNELEIQDWMATLNWLAGKCTFCVGRGLDDTHLSHTLRQCKRGGASHMYQGLGEMFMMRASSHQSDARSVSYQATFAQDGKEAAKENGS
ncbi:hypothetical protein DER45DRAFT_540209 [Fusarium avenaceum]|nr:hypothetical protein DER45DRAFT_540209 [Fusarium avenaceum]